MTEQEWLTATDPVPGLELLNGTISDRKLILFSLACWTTPEWYRETDWEEAIDEFTDKVLAGTMPLNRLVCLFGVCNFEGLVSAERWARIVTRKHPSQIPPSNVQADLLREVAGNPFCPVRVEPRWLSRTWSIWLNSSAKTVRSRGCRSWRTL